MNSQADPVAALCFRIVMLRCSIKLPSSSERRRARLRDELALHYDVTNELLDRRVDAPRGRYIRAA